MQAPFDSLPPFLAPYAAIIAAGVTIASALSAVLPSRSTNKAYDLFLRTISFVALNFGKAKNADDKPPAPPAAG